MQCPVCGGASEVLLVHSGWKHVRCSRCGHVFLADPPSQEALSEFYSTTENALWNTGTFALLEAYRRNPAALQRYYRRDRVRYLPGALGNGTTVLDIGCGSGVFLATLRDAGAQVTGHDLSPRSTEAGKQALGIDLVSGPLSNVQGPFDVITAYDVVEHWRDPAELIASIRSLSHAETTVVLRTPNHGSWLRAITGQRWLWYLPPAHIHLFTAASLCGLLERGGFEVTSVQTLASSYIYFAAHYLATDVVAPGKNSLDMPRWKEWAIYAADGLLRLALSPLLMVGARRHGNPLLEVHARLRG